VHREQNFECLDLYISSSSSIEEEEVANFLISLELSSKPERVLDVGHFRLTQAIDSRPATATPLMEQNGPSRLFLGQP
jgi:hypothetical protein